VDGVLLKTVHASVALEQGADLLFCLNPIVPLDARTGAALGQLPEDVLTSLGLVTVLSQTFRTLIHSRLRLGLSGYRARFPHSDVVLLEPSGDAYEMFFSNVFSFRSRRRICGAAYHATRADLRRRRVRLAPLLARHGLALRVAVLDDDARELWEPLGIDGREDVFSTLDRALSRIERRLAPG
jgi:hypothetical protein